MFLKIKKYIPVRIKQNIKNFTDNFLHFTDNFFISILETLTGKYITFHTRPKYSVDVNVFDDQSNYDCSDYAIIVQGPVKVKDDFTLETLLLYKKYFSNALIILSTWEGEDSRCADLARKSGIEIIFNKKPDYAGPVNINMQLVSSRAGAEFALKKNKKYLLKTRTDMRIYNRESLFFLSNLLKAFPITLPNIKQTGRIIGISICGARKKLYHFPDLFIFGYASDVFNYFDADLVRQDNIFESVDLNDSFRAEKYLLTEFLKKSGCEVKNNYDDYMRVLAKNCMFVDSSSLLGCYWHKYRRYLEYRNLQYKERYYLIGFSEWLNLYYLYN